MAKGKRMQYYLDIDGTIITKDRHEADGLHEFLNFVFDTGEVLWLTTHCREMDTSSALFHLKPILQPKNYSLVSRIKATQWRTLKTEAIHFGQPFFWFDDYVLEAEKRILDQNGCLSNWVSIDLASNENNICKAVRVASSLVIPRSAD